MPQKVVNKDILEKEHVDAEKKIHCLQTALYQLTKNQAFFGMILQCLDMFYTHQIPTAGVCFDNNAKKWQMMINPKWFCDKLGDGDKGTRHRISILLHELYHLTHKHIIRAPMLKLNPGRRMLMNIAMDMAINQYIKDLPSGCSDCPPRDNRLKGAECQNEMCPGNPILVEDFFDTDDKGTQVPWEKNKPFEYYYYKLIEHYSEMSDNPNEDGEGNGGGQSGNRNSIPKEFDSHDWDSSSEEQDMMDATEELVKRAMQKRGLAFDKLPGFIQELLTDIEARRSELNYRQLILSAIKKHASGADRISTWSKPSRRYGNIAPGSRNGPLPKLESFIDTSGSISIQEANDFLSIIDNFLQVGHRKCRIGLWHTDLYRNETYKLGDRLDRSVIQSGGTDVGPVLKYISEAKPDLSIILTDGCFSNVDFESMLPPNTLFPQVIWIISQDGTEQHPLTRLGETVKIPRTNALKSDRDLEV
jgi:predicted metal-dependent peptidase